MRIPCPYCGERDAQEFAYLGDAERVRRPSRAARGARTWLDYVYLRDNPAGAASRIVVSRGRLPRLAHRERDTRTHGS